MVMFSHSWDSGSQYSNTERTTTSPGTFYQNTLFDVERQ